MYKIFNRELEKEMKFVNLEELERYFINEYKNNTIKLFGTYSDVKYHVYSEKVDGILYPIGGLYAVSIKTGHDSYGNPLYMVIVFKDKEHLKTIKSKQSYYIDGTIQKIFCNLEKY